MPTVAEDVLRLSEHAPPDGQIDPSVLADVVRRAHAVGQYVADADLLERARLATAARRRTEAAIGRTDEHGGWNGQTAAPSWKSRLTTSEKVLAVRTAEILEALRGHIEQTRIGLFGQSTPPCATLAEAEAWIIAHTSASRNASAIPIRYYPAAGGLHVRGTDKGAQDVAWRLSKSAEQFEAWTAIPAPSFITHLLTGLIPGKRTHLSNGRRAVLPGLDLAKLQLRDLPIRPRRRRLSIELDIADLTDHNLRLIRQDAYHRFGLSRTPHRSATTKQQKIAGIVARLGGPPARQWDVQFWRKVQKEYNRGTRENMTDPIAVARRFWTARARGVV